jgi:hypothetical protein
MGQAGGFCSTTFHVGDQGKKGWMASGKDRRRVDAQLSTLLGSGKLDTPIDPKILLS